jgi:AcrR family transcriptional regulator
MGSTSRGEDGGSRREARKAETRERLLEVAGRLFVENGFENTTFGQIAQVAGVARQTVFNYYAKKDDFVIAWGERQRAHIADVLARTSDTESAVSRLILTIGAVADDYEHNADAGRAFTIAWVRSGGPVFEERMLSTQFADLLADGQRTGEIRSDIDVLLGGHLLRAAYFDALWAWAAPDRPTEATSLFAGMLDRMELLLLGLCPAEAATSLRRTIALARSLEATRTRANTSTPAEPV